MKPIELILHPTDFSDNSDAAIPWVVEFAKRFGARVMLLHEIDMTPYAVSYEIEMPTESMRETMHRSAERQIAALAERLRAEGVASIQTRVEVGHGSTAICKCAREHGVDLIIMSTHGRTGLKHILIGSTAERVVQHAPRLVLTVRT
jgi:nucleotide-binding universal stress UspA family protein